MSSGATVVILAAGQGTRMRSRGPKVLHPLCGRPMLDYVLDQARSLLPDRIVVVVGAGADQVRKRVEVSGDPRIRTVVQEQQLGTGHALRCALPWISGGSGEAEASTVVVLYGDMPLLREGTLKRLMEARDRSGPGMALLTALPAEPRGFGRVVRASSAAGAPVVAIVEERDAQAEELAIREVNVGVYAFPGPALTGHLARLAPHNAQGEYYLTDVVSAFVAEGRRVEAEVIVDPDEAIGVNTLSHLAEARAVIQERILESHMAAGVYIEDPATAYIDWGVEIGAGARILPCTVIRSGVRIGAGCEVGPFSHLRAGTVLEERAEVGNFTETKKAVIGRETKAKHLSYLGDVRIGEGANIGAGTIVANYDGKEKHETEIGDHAFIGSGSVLVAPTKVGRGALTGAGAVVTRGTEIPDHEAWVGVPARFLKTLPTEPVQASHDAHEEAE